MQVDTHPPASIASLMASAASVSRTVPQKRKEPPTEPPSRPSPPARTDSQSETDAGTQSTSPTDEYGSGRIICETCGDGISIRDEATGAFTVKHWDAHRVTCQNGSQNPPEFAPDTPSAPPDASQPLAKRRRAKRTEEERIAYLRGDPYVAKFEAYRVLCASCDKWIRLRPNSTYCSIPWDAHRKSCLAKRHTKTARPVDDRNAMFTSDPNIKRFDSERVLCRICEKWVSIVSENNASAVKMWMQHRSACQPGSSPGPGSSTSKFNIANVPPPPKHLLALASSSSLPPPPPTSAHVPTVSNPAQPSPSVRASSTGTFSTSFKEFTPNALPQESRRRNADQRAAALRADPLLGEVEPARVFCKLCQKWVQLRQDSTYCSYPWLQHRVKCLQRRQKIAEREAAIAELRATRDAALEGQLVASDSSATPEPEEGAEGEDADRAHHKAERRRAKAMAKAEAATARLRQLEGAHGRSASAPSSEDDDAMWDYIDVDVAAPPKLADLNSSVGRLEFVARSIRHLYRVTYERADELTIATLVTYLNATMPPDKHEDFDTAEVTKAAMALQERGSFVFEGDVIRITP